MRHSLKILVWLQIALLLSTTMSYKCADQIELKPVAGFDIQIYNTPNDYRSLYVQRDSPDFVLISQRKRKTGQLSKADHSKILNALSEENKIVLFNKSILGSDSIDYPYLSIKERDKNNSSNITDFFVILPLNSDDIILSELTELIDNIFTKYQE